MKSRKARVAIGAGLASVMGLTLVPEPAFADPVSDESAFVARLNGVRASRGLAPLGINGPLTNTARAWSAQMAARGRISHNPHLAAQAPGNWARLGENVGMGPSVDSLHNAFVASPGHYANMVNGHYNSVGVGVVQSGATKFVTFNFMAAGGHAPAVSRPARSRCTRVRRGRRVRVVCRKSKARRATKARRVGSARRAAARRR